MSNKLLLVGIAGGLAVAIALASLFSGAIATAQTQHGSPIQGMMKHSMFSASGMSTVSNVRITGVSITGENEVSVNVTYNGNGSAPSVTVIAMTNHRQMMSMMGASSMAGMSGGMMMGSQSKANMGMDVMGGNPNNSMMSSMPHGNYTGIKASIESQTGSALVESGWQSGGNTVTIRLDGDASAYEASDVHVAVFPHLT